MRILKFKSQLTTAFFTAVNHLNWPLRKQNFTLTGSKGQVLWFVIGGFRSVLCFCVSRFVACDRNYDWRERKTQLWTRLLNFRVRMFVKSTVMWLKCSLSRKNCFLPYSRLFSSNSRYLKPFSISLEGSSYRESTVFQIQDSSVSSISWF